MSGHFNDNVEAAATSISGTSNIPVWMHAFLAKQVEHVAIYVHSDQNAPTREDHISKTKDMLKYTDKLISLLDEKSLQYLRAVKYESCDQFSELPAVLAELKYRLIMDLESVNSQKKKGEANRRIPTHDGKPAIIVDGAVYAAAVCLGTWEVVRGHRPGITNGAAHDAAAEIWRAAGGSGNKAWLQIMQKALSSYAWLIDDTVGSANLAKLLAGVNVKPPVI